MTMFSGTTPRETTSSSRPHWSRIRVQFGAICSPAPTSPNSAARSSTRTRSPLRDRASALARPPMPPPTTMASAASPARMVERGWMVIVDSPWVWSGVWARGWGARVASEPRRQRRHGWAVGREVLVVTAGDVRGQLGEWPADVPRLPGAGDGPRVSGGSVVGRHQLEGRSAAARGPLGRGLVEHLYQELRVQV